jgi:hypothetical protein
MNISRRAIAFGLAALLVVLAVGTAFFLYGHRRFSTTDSYFSQREAGRVNEDVKRTIDLLAPFLNSPPGDFTAYGQFPVAAHKYSIAFTAYALANVAVIEPRRKPEIARWIDNLIQKMVYLTVWEDWRQKGWGENPLETSNVMWKGHLNLMYALHLLVSGEDKYEGCFHRLSEAIAEEMRHTEYGGAACEAINYYFHCNTVSMLALRYHDVMYGTRYEGLQAKWLGWARDHMVVTAKDVGHEALTNENVGLICAVHHPLSKSTEKRMSGYTNAWAVTFLNFFEPEWARQIYASYKSTFITRFWRFAYSQEVPGHGIDGLATLFALFAAKEFDDRDLFDQLVNVLTLAGRERFDSANPEFAAVGSITVDFPTNPALQGPLLFGKTNIGVGNLFKQAHPLKHGESCKTCVEDGAFEKLGVKWQTIN